MQRSTYLGWRLPKYEHFRLERAEPPWEGKTKWTNHLIGLWKAILNFVPNIFLSDSIARWKLTIQVNKCPVISSAASAKQVSTLLLMLITDGLHHILWYKSFQTGLQQRQSRAHGGTLVMGYVQPRAPSSNSWKYGGPYGIVLNSSVCLITATARGGRQRFHIASPIS